MKFGTCHIDEISKKSRKTSQEMGSLGEFVKDEETQTTQRNDLKNNNTWLTAAKNIYVWEKKEKQYTKHVIDDWGTLTPLNTTTKYHSEQQHHQQPHNDDEDPVLFDPAGATERQRRPSALRRLRSDIRLPRCSIIDNVWHTQCTAQDK